MKLSPKLAILVLCAFSSSSIFAVPPVILKAGMLIKKSVQVKKDTYFLSAGDSLSSPLIRIEGNNITIDFAQAVLQGSNNRQLPNQFYGLALYIKGNNITIKNAVIRGYKVALMAEGCKNLKIEHCDFSYNYRQHLQSSWQGEDVSDWMSYHHNENDEWLRYGAAMYLKDCGKPIVRYNTATNGQCALMLMRCNDGLINDNDFTFNSAIGIGMYRSSRNKIMHNKLDFNVRGYSHGFYNRGQDSAGILVFEQCNENVFAYNSVTHGGDGFFLWAGQTTMDTGEGGCNDNYLVENDFSYAPTNGIEVTFSKNHIFYNTIKECDHGIWGGYSWETAIVQNKFAQNRIGIAIEHGQYIAIMNNSFTADKEAIRLWARKTQPADWGYAQKRDTKSRNYRIWENTFSGNNTGANITLTNNIEFIGNKFSTVEKEIKKDSSVTNFVTEIPAMYDSAGSWPPVIKNWPDKTIPPLRVAAGKEQIRITEWGPYNYNYPIVFLKKIDSNNVYHFDILGAKGSWKLISSNDLKNISQSSGSFPARLTAIKNGEDVALELEYSGPSFTDAFGKRQPVVKPYVFSFRDYKPGTNWNVNWYKWDATHNPNKIPYDSFKNFINSSNAIKSEKIRQLNYTWWGAIGTQLPADSFATVCTTTVTVKKGLYNLGVTADDLVKVFIDGKLVIDFWDAKKYVYDEDAHHSAIVELNGRHEIRIEQVENSGFATLLFSIKPL